MLSKRMQGMNDDFRQINITTEKITKRFDEISNVELTADEVSYQDSIE